MTQNLWVSSTRERPSPFVVNAVVSPPACSRGLGGVVGGVRAVARNGRAPLGALDLAAARAG